MTLDIEIDGRKLHVEFEYSEEGGYEIIRVVELREISKYVGRIITDMLREDITEELERIRLQLGEEWEIEHLST